MPSHFDPKKLPPTMADDSNGKQAVKAHGRDDHHIDGGYCASVIAQEFFQVCDGGLLPRTRNFGTVDWATSYPGINNSPWIGEAPHRGLS